MLSARQESLIRSLHTKKGRTESGLCLIEGKKNIAEAKDFIEFSFGPDDSRKYEQLLETVTPQNIAAVARIPAWETEQIQKKDIIVLLDGVQDPGNVGTILRLCLGFNASLALVESADPASPKVVRSSAGAFFNVPWLDVKRDEATAFIKSCKRDIVKLEKKNKSQEISPKLIKTLPKKLLIIVGSEGQGISLKVTGQSIHIAHEAALESLNVSTALAIALFELYSRK
jgi:TrmH family RNA methyltransferase